MWLVIWVLKIAAALGLLLALVDYATLQINDFMQRNGRGSASRAGVYTMFWAFFTLALPLLVFWKL